MPNFDWSKLGKLKTLFGDMSIPPASAEYADDLARASEDAIRTANPIERTAIGAVDQPQALLGHEQMPVIPEAQPRVVEGEVLPSDRIGGPAPDAPMNAETGIYSEGVPPQSRGPLSTDYDQALEAGLSPAEKAARMSNKQKYALLTGGAGGAGLIGYGLSGGSDDPKQRAIQNVVANPSPDVQAQPRPDIIPARKSPVPGVVREPPVPEMAQASAAPEAQPMMEEPVMPSIATQDNLQDAIDRKDEIQLANRLGRAGELIGTGISGAKPVAQEAFNEQIKSADDVVQDFEKKVANEENDPQSQVSQQFREFAKQFGITLPPKTSAKAAQKIMPYAYQKFAASEAQKARREEQAERLKAAKEMKETSLEVAKIGAAGKQAEKNSDEKREFTRKLRTELQSKEYGKMLADYNTASRATSALESFSKDPTGYSDYGMLMSSLKTLQGDQSVVREAEIRLGKDATSLFNKVENYVQSAATGKSLQPNQRTDMVNAIKQLREITKDSYIRNIQPVLEQARAEGIDETVLLPEGLRKAPTIQKGKDSRDIPAPDDNGAPGKIVKEKPLYNQTPGAGGLVKIRRKSTGTTKTLSAEGAAKYLSDLDFEKVE